MRSAEALIFFDNGVYGLDDGGLEALLFKDMHALDRRAAGRGDLSTSAIGCSPVSWQSFAAPSVAWQAIFCASALGSPAFTPAEESASMYICTNAPEAPPSAENAENCASGIS